MSAEEMHPTPLSDKNGVIGHPEADEDTRTESSEGSNTQTQWTSEAGESEDEFEDAMEPPSSTSGMLLMFDGSAAPLSGVYEDAVEATDEQVLAAIVSTGSDGRQSTIQEEEEEEEQEEEKENEIEDDIIAVVDGIVERVAAIAEEGAGVSDKEFADKQVEPVVESLMGDVKGAVSGEDDVAKEVVDGEDVDTGALAAEDAVVDESPKVPKEEVAEADNEVLGVPGVLVDKQEIAPVDDGLAVESAQESDPSIEEEATEIVDDNTDEATPEAPAVVETERMEDGAVADTAEDVGLVPVVETTQPETIGAVEGGTDAEDINTLEGENDAEAITEEEVDDQPLSAQESTEVNTVDESVADVPYKPSTEEKAPIAHSTEGATAEVEKVVAQVTNELVEAILLEHDKADHADEEDVEEKPAPDSVREEFSTGKTNSKADDNVLQEDSPARSTAPASDRSSVVKGIIDSYRKSSEDYPNSGVLLPVLGLLPRLEPSSGATTTTTIEPFILSSESNEMMEMHPPPQRWTYEVYGFSIEDRVVYYHIHRSDRRTGIRQPPILKRYTDFRELQVQLLDTRLHAATDMPLIPRPHLGTVFRGYRSKKTIEIREKAFRALLRYISQYPALHGSSIFERFITTTQASTGAGWM
ncbi:hypothetical protein P3T76_014653 [Phytophthora citrophthora]|uniref:PX domain-containing protein n=1 Tax=Phytophthora citrophthora TaxID=4793 RepID=A0AAD9G0S6_9STRA|nr:hypothetical protein P3T76_014653 [Phytophthora citrophthora]